MPPVVDTIRPPLTTLAIVGRIDVVAVVSPTATPRPTATVSPSADRVAVRPTVDPTAMSPSRLYGLSSVLTAVRHSTVGVTVAVA